jgi:hypothetical protein
MSTAITLCLAAVNLNPVNDVISDRVDLIEINHFHDEQGRRVFDQIIFYDWSPAESRFNVRDWRLLKSPSQIPLRNWRGRDFVTIWHDFKQRDVLRKVHARMIRETWTQYDPELVEREFLALDKRRALRKFLAASLLEEGSDSHSRTAQRSGPLNTIRR